MTLENTKQIVKCFLCGNQIDIKNEIHFTYEALKQTCTLCKTDGDYILIFMRELSEMKKIIPHKEELS